MADLLVGRVLAAVANVRGHGSGEEHRLLRDEADPRAQIGLRHLADVDAVHQHAPLVDVVEPRNQPGERRLARAGAADDRGHLARHAPSNDTPVSAGSSAPGYWKVTFWNST